MPNDAKFGVALGLGMVIAVAVIFFHKEEPIAPPQAVAPPVAATKADRPHHPRAHVSAQPAILSREIDTQP